MLQEDDFVQKFQSSDGRTAVYQYMEKLGNCQAHLHIQCMKCGKLLQLDCAYMMGF
jgi:Fur family ferric uptake transcriptional regulator